MTLVLTEISRYGIAMAADSAITETFPPELQLASGRSVPPVVRTGAQKLIPVPQAGAAISCWGLAQIGTRLDQRPRIPLDVFLLDFTKQLPAGIGLEEIGCALVQELNPRIEVGRARGGLHLCGFIPHGSHKVPAAYTVHTGPEGSTQLPLQLYKDFPNPESLSLDAWVGELNGKVFYIRNGDYLPYSVFSESLHALLQSLRKDFGISIPDPSRFSDPLEGRGHFLRLQVSTICEFYRLSGLAPSIAEPVSWLTIGPEGIRQSHIGK